MKVGVNLNTAHFCELDVLETFLFGGRLYLKVFDTNTCECCAVDLKEGDIDWFEDNPKIMPIKTKLVIDRD